MNNGISMKTDASIARLIIIGLDGVPYQFKGFN